MFDSLQQKKRHPFNLDHILSTIIVILMHCYPKHTLSNNVAILCRVKYLINLSHVINWKWNTNEGYRQWQQKSLDVSQGVREHLLLTSLSGDRRTAVYYILWHKTSKKTYKEYINFIVIISPSCANYCMSLSE